MEMMRMKECVVCGGPTKRGATVCAYCQHTCPICGGFKRGRYAEHCRACRDRQQRGTVRQATLEDIHAAVARYLAGETLRHVAVTCGISRSSLREIFRRRGMAIRQPPRYPDRQSAQAARQARARQRWRTDPIYRAKRAAIQR